MGEIMRRLFEVGNKLIKRSVSWKILFSMFLMPILFIRDTEPHKAGIPTSFRSVTEVANFSAESLRIIYYIFSNGSPVWWSKFLIEILWFHIFPANNYRVKFFHTKFGYNDTEHFSKEKKNRAYYFKKVKEVWTLSEEAL